MNSIARWFHVSLWLLLFGYASSQAAPWPPKGFVLEEDTVSTDKHYGILIPSREDAPDDDDAIVNYLADLKTKRLLGKIDDASYTEGRNHRGLAVIWSADSTWCIAQYDARFGFASIFALEPNGKAFTQTDLGTRVQNGLDTAIKKQSRAAKDPASGGDGSAFYRPGADRKIHVRALATTNPKQFPDQKTYYSLFQGTYDLNAHRWTVTDARSVSSEEYDTLQGAYDEASFQNNQYNDDQSHFDGLDQRMNEVYQAVRFIVPPERFTKVKQEQIAWLKTREAAGSQKEQITLMTARIKVLQDLLW